MISRQNELGTDASRSGPLVSVIVPAYNAERFIAQALESVLVQTHGHLEILVVDDGSSDRTPEIARGYAEKDSRVTLLRQPNQGVAAARNAAIGRARGSYIAPLDADDLWCPSKLQCQVEALANAPSAVGLVYVWSRRIDESGAATGRCRGSRYQGSVFLPLLIANFIGNASSPLIRAECFRTVGGYDPIFRQRDAQGCEDWEMYLRISERYRFLAIPECLVKYRQSPASMSANPGRMARSHRVLTEWMRDRHTAVPDFVHRWSAGGHSLYVAGICTRHGAPRTGLKYLLHALYLDPATFLNKRFHQLLFKNLARTLGVADWLRKKRRFGDRESATGTGEASEEAAGALWARVRDRRHARLLKLQHRLGLTVGDGGDDAKRR